ncbi:hypothetical protein DTL21_17390 [Bremerella cremea]|uniref:Uncharacterized protein n=1 Tax=Blastopirellula marina TaxID=124 RepID=A0A2S8FIJ5_9BACT|nr:MULTISPECIES: hypothetical protein [Pirellulaceae]PQO32019.1 hypothetical protein C5Y83_17375 [Blastopirellula marina]RCS45086.1 hypothetical protein DTL21_17390 [Bremerella cremea]
MGWEYFTQDQGLGNLLFREISPRAYGFGGPGDNRFDLESMQQVDFYFHRSFPGLMEDNEYYWQQVSKGSQLAIRAKYNLFLNLETPRNFPTIVEAKLSLGINGDVEKDHRLIQTLRHARDEGGIRLSIFGFGESTIAPERLREMRGQFQAKACIKAIDLLLRIQALRDARGSEQAEAEKNLWSFLDGLEDIERQTMTHYCVIYVPEGMTKLVKQLKAEVQRDRFHPVDSVQIKPR